MKKQFQVITLAGLFAVFAVLSLSAATPQWPQFRGPGGSGVSDKEKPLVHFGPGSNQLWKVSVPTGASSPCVWDKSIFLTAFNDGKLETLCLNRKTGEIKWRQTAPAKQIEKYHLTEGSPASATPASDGKIIVSYFGSCGLICYDFAGKEKWRLELPVVQQGGDFGSGASPVLAGKLVVMNRDQSQGAELLAVNLATGKIAWRTDRTDIGSGFSTPVAWKHDGIEELVLPGYLQLRSYDSRDGAERWRVRGLPSGVCTTPVVGEGMVFFAGWSPGADAPFPTFDTLAAKEDVDKDGIITFEEASEGMKNFFNSYDNNRDKKLTREEWDNFRTALMKGKNALLAIKSGGKGDITETHVAWNQTRGLPYVASPLFYRGRIYIIKDGGMMSCFDAKTGEPVYQQERIGAIGSYYASPVAADGRIFVAAITGTVSVIQEAGEKPEVLGRTEFKERLVATPALADNKIYIRTADHLWAFGK